MIKIPLNIIKTELDAKSFPHKFHFIFCVFYIQYFNNLFLSNYSYIFIHYGQREFHNFMLCWPDICYRKLHGILPWLFYIDAYNSLISKNVLPKTVFKLNLLQPFLCDV